MVEKSSVIIRRKEPLEKVDVVIVGWAILWTTRGMNNVLWYVVFSEF